MEPDVIRMYSSSPPPMEDGAEEEEDEFSDFTGVPNSISFTEFDTPTMFNQLQALNATSPPEFIGNGRIVGLRGPAPPAKCNGDAPTCRTVNIEELKKDTEPHHGSYTNCSDISGSTTRTACDDADRNGSVGGVESLTNGFAAFDTEGSPPSCHKHRDSAPSEDYSPDAVINDNEDDFADFAAFSNADVHAHFEQVSHQGERLAVDDDEGERVAKDTHVTGFASLPLTAEASDGLSNGERGFHEGAGHEQRDSEINSAHQDSNIADSGSTDQATALNSLDVKEKGDNRMSPVSEDEGGSSSEPTGNDTETETETSFGRPLSTDALEEFGDFSTTGSVPSPPLQEETATPADHSQLAEEDDEDFGDFGDFGDASSFGGAGFADFDQQAAAGQPASAESAPQPNPEFANEDEFGDFDAPRGPSQAGQEDERGAEFADFPGSDSFADFTSAPVDGAASDPDGGWQAFNEPESNEESGESWAAFGPDHNTTFSEKSNTDWHENQSAPAPSTGSREESLTVSSGLISRLEQLFLATFPEAPMALVGEDVPPLKAFLRPSDRSEQEDDGVPKNGSLQAVWCQLQDIHNALGLQHQWGGSHSNKTLLSSLGIDTRNILFTGQKKQPVIVPMYAASLGMLEPTKEPVKPVSAAEMIASIAQSPSVTTEMSSCPPDTGQESLPPVQFDWSSSGLTNPLDASGGSSLLNLDFFGPVDESPSSAATSIPGVDPELYELTQSKLEVGGGSVMADAFARLMSTVEKTNTSTSRKVQREENLSEEARRVISMLPDLSFMQAKVLMFPSTLTPLPHTSSSPSPVPD